MIFMRRLFCVVSGNFFVMSLFNRFFQNRYFVFLLAALPLALYGVFFNAILLNANYIAYDDSHVLQIITQWHNAASWRERLDWLTIGFPEHRIVFTRTTVLVCHWLTGSVNLKNLLIISNLLWIGQLGILYKVFLKLKPSLPFTYFIPVCWLLLNVHSFENIFWPTSSLGNFGLLFFVMAAGYFYSTSVSKKAYLAWALVFSLMATFTYGNGLVSFLVGGVILALGQRWRDIGLTAAAFSLTMLLYALTRAHASPSGLDLTKLDSYGHALTCFFAFIGSSTNVDVYAPTSIAMWMSVGWGAVLFGAVCWYFLSKIIEQRFKPSFSSYQTFALYLFVFLCVTALGVVYKRAEGDGLIGMFKGRYRMYPTWLLVVAYLLLLGLFHNRERWFLPIAVAVSMLFNLLVLYYAVAPAVNNRRAAVVQEFNSMYNPDLLGLKMFEMSGEEFLQLQALYKPNLFFKESQNQLFPAVDSTQVRPLFALDSVYFVNNNLIINYQKEFIRPLKDFDDGAYLLLQSPTHTYMAAGMQSALPIKTFLRRGWYWDRGFTAIFNRASVAVGAYKLYILIRQNGQTQLMDTGQRLTF